MGKSRRRRREAASLRLDACGAASTSGRWPVEPPAPDSFADAAPPPASRGSGLHIPRQCAVVRVAAGLVKFFIKHNYEKDRYFCERVVLPGSLPVTVKELAVALVTKEDIEESPGVLTEAGRAAGWVVHEDSGGSKLYVHHGLEEAVPLSGMLVPEIAKTLGFPEDTDVEVQRVICEICYDVPSLRVCASCGAGGAPVLPKEDGDQGVNCLKALAAAQRGISQRQT